MQALVCFSACLFTLQTNDVVREEVGPDLYNLLSNATCTDFCIVPGGICDRALPPGVPANCMDDCRTNLCPSSCQNIQNNFNLTTGSVSAFGSGVELELGFAEDVTLRKNGVMEIFATYAEPLPLSTPPGVPFTIPPPPLSPSKAYGLIWRVYQLDGSTKYIPQHLPLFLLRQDVGPLYRAGSNLFAIRELQCKSRKLEYALVNDQGVGRFTTVNKSDTQCFYGSWFPRPPKNISADLRFQQSTGGLEAQFKADEFSLDSQYVEEYRVQVLSTNRDSSKSCRKYASITVLGDMAFQIENNSLVARIETTQVTQFFPNVLHDCNVAYVYYVVVYATTQNSTSCSKYPVGDVYTTLAKFPDYKYISLDMRETIVRDHVSGRADVSIETNITSHWTSLAVLSKWGGIMRVKDWPVEETQHRSVPAVPTQTIYVLNFTQLKPHTKGEEYSFSPEYFYRYNGITFPSTESHQVHVPTLRPGPVQNMTVTAVAEQGGTLSLNVSWMGPLRPEGRVRSYFICVGSPRATTLNDKTVTVEGAAQTDMSIPQESHISIDLFDDEHFNVSVQAISEYGEEGEFEVVQIDNVFIDEPRATTSLPRPADSGPAWYLYVFIGVIFVLFVVFLVILGVFIYYCYKRNKVSEYRELERTRYFLRRNATLNTTGDDWELDPSHLYMNNKLGEGNFGEVYRATLSSDLNSPRVKKYAETVRLLTKVKSPCFVAIKVLRSNAPSDTKQSFLNEIEMMKTLASGTNMHVVKMIGCVTIQEPLALILEFVPYGNLLDYLRTNRKLAQERRQLESKHQQQRIKRDSEINRRSSEDSYFSHLTPQDTPKLSTSPLPCELKDQTDSLEVSSDFKPSASPYTVNGDHGRYVAGVLTPIEESSLHSMSSAPYLRDSEINGRSCEGSCFSHLEPVHFLGDDNNMGHDRPVSYIQPIVSPLLNQESVELVELGGREPLAAEEEVPTRKESGRSVNNRPYDHLGFTNPYLDLGELEAFNLMMFTYQIASGMEYLASLGIVHRDLACRNVLVDRDKILKISDFGLSRETDLYVSSTQGKLPLRWMSPEAILDRVFTEKSDVWAYGITIWEICTLGGYPYATIPNKAVLQSLISGYRLEKPHNCSEEIHKVMLRCWEMDSDNRPDFRDLREHLDNLMEHHQADKYIKFSDIDDDKLPYYKVGVFSGSGSGSGDDNPFESGNGTLPPQVTLEPVRSNDPQDLMATNQQNQKEGLQKVIPISPQSSGGTIKDESIIGDDSNVERKYNLSAENSQVSLTAQDSACTINGEDSYI